MVPASITPYSDYEYPEGKAGVFTHPLASSLWSTQYLKDIAVADTLELFISPCPVANITVAAILDTTNAFARNTPDAV
jgi:hypothetical protein